MTLKLNKVNVNMFLLDKNVNNVIFQINSSISSESILMTIAYSICISKPVKATKYVYGM